MTTRSVSATRHRPTMRDVAALSGVSLKTVSRVVNREPGVSNDLVERVLAAAEQLDYQPNLTASSLRRNDGKTRTIGLLLEDVGNPYSSTLHRTIEDVARQRGVVVFAGSLDEDPERERELATALTARRVDGLIIVPAAKDQSYLASERKSGTPIVFVDRPPVNLDADCVVTDNTLWSRKAVSHLIDQGHTRIAFLGDLASISTAEERFAGYRAALDRAELVRDPALIRQNLRTSDAAVTAVNELLALNNPPTALFASQNLVTIGAIRALRAAHRQRDVALVGFDDIPLVDLIEPGITLVVQDVTGLAAAAADLLFRRLDGDTGPTERIVLPAMLVIGGSGEIAPPHLRSTTVTT